MRNRLLIGRYRYGKMDRVDCKNYEQIGSALRRMHTYQATGNMEHLVDVANLCLMEYEHSTHPNKHFAAADDGDHVPKSNEGE